jgi:hypothetical protein
VNRHNLIIWGSQNPHQISNIRETVKGECFLCCKQNTNLRIILFRRNYHYGSQVPRHAGALPFHTTGCKQCDLETRWGPSLLSQGCDALTKPNIPSNMEDVTATFRRHANNPICHPCSFYFYFFGFVKDNMYIPPMPVDVQELHDRIVNTIALKGSDDGVLHLEKSCFWTLSIVQCF